MIKFLEEIHEGDTQKYFKHLPSEKIEQARQNKENGVRIVGCQKSRMISLFPDGSWQIKRHLCSCDPCKHGEFSKCVGELSDHSIPDEIIDDNIDLLDENDDMDPEMYTFIEENSYIALYSAPNSLELFYIVKVVKKTIAVDDIDIYGHTVPNGSEYIEGHYLEKINEKKDKIYYKELKKLELKKLVYVYPTKIFLPSSFDE